MQLWMGELRIMITKLTVEDLKSFEDLVADTYNAGGIKAPVHLSGGNEQQLIDIFQDVKERDWVFTTWRSHYHCLLKGVPPDKLMKDICDGYSITLTYPEQRIVSSAIVGGILPIALGVALAIERMGGNETVWAFVGDMTAHGGSFHESLRYSVGHDLPIKFVIEDNDKSVGTPTEKVWMAYFVKTTPSDRVIHYKYELPWPHAGAGKWVEF